MKNLRITVNGKVYEVTVEEVAAGTAPAATVAAPVAAPAPAPVAAKAPAAPAAAPAAANVAGTKVTCPMPGNVLDVKVSVGQKVKKGDTVLVLEAMKMENDIPAPCDGTVVARSVQKGATPQAGDTLAVIG